MENAAVACSVESAVVGDHSCCPATVEAQVASWEPVAS